MFTVTEVDLDHVSDNVILPSLVKTVAPHCRASVDKVLSECAAFAISLKEDP